MIAEPIAANLIAAPPSPDFRAVLSTVAGSDQITVNPHLDAAPVRVDPKPFRWILDGITWKRPDPWLTSFVDCSVDGSGSLLGLTPGRTGRCVKDRLAEQTPEFGRPSRRS